MKTSLSSSCCAGLLGHWAAGPVTFQVRGAVVLVNGQEQGRCVEHGCIFCLHYLNSVVDILPLSGSLRSCELGSWWCFNQFYGCQNIFLKQPCRSLALSGLCILYLEGCLCKGLNKAPRIQIRSCFLNSPVPPFAISFPFLQELNRHP